MSAKEKSDILSGIGAGFEILKRLRDSGATDADLRKLLSQSEDPHVSGFHLSHRVVHVLKGESIGDIIWDESHTLGRTVKSALQNGIPFQIGVKLLGDKATLAKMIDPMQNWILGTGLTGSRTGKDEYIIWINGRK